MTKLLNKPFKSFSIYALVILVCSIPVYYFVVDAIWLEELDEHNLVIREQTEQGLQRLNVSEADLDKTIRIWSSLQPGTSLVPITEKEIKKDRVYALTVYNKLAKERDRYRVLATCIRIKGKPYLLTISTNVEEVDETLLAIAVVTVLFFILLVLGFVYLNKRISGKSWKPFYSTLNQLKSYDISKNQDFQPGYSNIEEFDELNRALSALIDRNNKAFNQQKRFIENASHELQTPLAILKTKMDVFLQNETLSSGQSSMIEGMNANLSRISRINKNLLLLAKIENRQFADTAKVDVKHILEETGELLEDYLADKGMRLQADIHSLEITCNQTLLEVLIHNLLINAIRHGKANDEILISLTGNQLTFSNTGDHSLNTSQLFVRFGITSTETTNSGLGLAIAKEICERYNWCISYDFNESLHQFTIRF